MDETTSDIPLDVVDIIVDLDIIANVPTNHKLNTSDKTYANADSKIEAFWRWWGRESGDSTVDFINSTIDRAIKVGVEYPAWIDVLAKKVNGIEKALKNLKSIYERKHDQETASKITFIEFRINKKRFQKACQEKIVSKIDEYQPAQSQNVPNEPQKCNDLYPNFDAKNYLNE